MSSAVRVLASLRKAGDIYVELWGNRSVLWENIVVSLVSGSGEQNERRKVNNLLTIKSDECVLFCAAGVALGSG